MKWLVGLKDRLIRYVSKLAILSAIDGKKKEIMRLLQGINLIVLAVSALYPPWALVLNEKWQWVLVLVGHLGLEFAIEDEEIKIKKGLDPKVITRIELAKRRK